MSEARSVPGDRRSWKATWRMTRRPETWSTRRAGYIRVGTSPMSRHIRMCQTYTYAHMYACMHAPVTFVSAKTHNHTTHAQTYAYGRTRDTTVFNLTYSSIIEVCHHTEPSDSFWPVLQSVVRRSKQNGARPPFNSTNNVDNVTCFICYIMWIKLLLLCDIS